MSAKQPTPPPNKKCRPKPPPGPPIKVYKEGSNTYKDIYMETSSKNITILPTEGISNPFKEEVILKPTAPNIESREEGAIERKEVTKLQHGCKDCKFFFTNKYERYGFYQPLADRCNHITNFVDEFDPIWGNERFYIETDCKKLNKDGLCKNFKYKFSIF